MVVLSWTSVSTWGTKNAVFRSGEPDGMAQWSSSSGSSNEAERIAEAKHEQAKKNVVRLLQLHQACVFFSYSSISISALSAGKGESDEHRQQHAADTE